MVKIYHCLGPAVTLDVVLQEGLKSRRKLVEEGRTEPLLSHILLPDHMENIYFRYFDPEYALTLSSPWVAIEVDATNTVVYNAEFRADGNLHAYAASEQALAVFIEKLCRAEELRKTGGGVVIFNPQTAEPLLVPADDSRVSDPHWFYHHEIPLRRDIIPPAEFVSHHRGDR